MINLKKSPIQEESQNKLILCGLFMTAIDGEVDQSELDVVFNNPYWSNLNYEGCSDEFVSKLKDGTLLEFCREEVKTKLSDDADKQAFVNGMLHVILADGVVDEHEIALLIDLASQCGIGSDELNERISAFSSAGEDTKLILCALLMTAIDGDIDDSEIEVVFKDPYWSNFVYEGCAQEFQDMLSGGELVEFCRQECSKHVKTEAEKMSFIHGLLKIILADGVVDENETALLLDLGDSVGVSGDDLSAMIGSYGFVSEPKEEKEENEQEREEVPASNKLVLAALLMTAIDGDIDESEVNAIFQDEYWSRLVYDGCVDDFKARLDDGTVLDICRSEAAAHVTSDADKKDFVEGLIKIVLADGVVDDNEVALLVDLTSGIGISEDELNDLIQGRESSHASSVEEETKKWYDNNLILIVLVLVFWPGALIALFLRWRNK